MVINCRIINHIVFAPYCLSHLFKTAIMSDMKLRFEPTVPNILTLIRFFAIPVLAYLILAGDSYNLMAFFLFAAIWLTDLLDGYIARNFNQVTEFGKLFDPFVDKLFQFTIAIMMFAVGKLPIWVPVIIFAKELLMIAGSALLLKKRETVVFAAWYGKIGTVLYVVAFAVLFFLSRDQRMVINLIFILPVGWSLYACIRYAMAYMKPLFNKKDQTGSV